MGGFHDAYKFVAAVSWVEWIICILRVERFVVLLAHVPWDYFVQQFICFSCYRVGKSRFFILFWLVWKVLPITS